MRIVCKVLLSLVLLQGFAYAEEPEIQVVDGKVTMSAQAVPLGRLLSLLDVAMGMSSQVLQPELANRAISVRFSNLEVKDAVRKIFEGQPLNYILIEGKGIRVTDLALNPSASGSSTSTASSFPASQPISTLTPAGPVQPALAPPVNAAGQPAVVNVPFGAQLNPTLNPNQNATVPSAGAPSAFPGTVAPGQLPPPIGANNPLSPLGAAPGVGTSTPVVAPTPVGTPAAVGLPAAPPAAAPLPAGPGVSNATPGVAPR